MLWKQLAIVVLVTTTVYLLFPFVARFMGRKTIAGMTMSDFVAGVTMGSIGGGFVSHYFKGAPVAVASLLVIASWRY